VPGTTARYAYDWADRITVQRKGDGSTIGFEYDHTSTVRTRETDTGNIRHEVSTTVNSPLLGSVTVEWWIQGGFIQFDFTNQNYWGVLWRGGSYEFAREMFSIARSIDSEYLSGRTVRGLELDLQFHWAASKPIGAFRDNPFVARIGGTNRNMPGYDINAWCFEAANVATASAANIRKDVRYQP